MMLKVFSLMLTLVTCCVVGEECRPSADDLVKVLETEVDSYDHFIYGRYLDSEEETCRRVTSGMSRLRDAFAQELNIALGATRRQLRTIVATAAGTDAEHCVREMENVLDRGLNEERIQFRHCLGVPATQLEGVQGDLLRDTQIYKDLTVRTKAAVKNCLVNASPTCPTATNKCMDTQMLNFNALAKNLTESRHLRSPCMSKFVEALECFSTSVESYLKRVRIVQKKTTACVSFEDNSSIRQSILAFTMNLTLNSSLLQQVESAQRKFQQLNSGLVKTLGKYYELEKSARMTYEFSPHDQKHFQQRLDAVFTERMRSVETVRCSKRYVWPKNKADQCCDRALSDIRSVISNAAQSLEKCEEDLLRQTQTHIQRVRGELRDVTKYLLGDSVIMDCLNDGAILTENAVEDCYDLHQRRFLLDKQDALERVGESMAVLERYNSTYFNVSESTKTLCSNSFLKRTEWSVDKILFQLSRCPYTEVEDWTTSGSTPTYPWTTGYYYTTPEYPTYDDYPVTYPH